VSANTDLIRSFIEAWNRNDADAVMTHFTDDAVYHNIPVEPVQGLEEIRKTIDGFAGMSEEIKWELHAIAEDENGSVFTERTDSFKIGGKWVGIPVMGIFEVKGGKVSAWRDYFDMNMFTSQMPGADG